MRNLSMIAGIGLALLAIGLINTAPASAGWRYAEWGMTEHQVEDASGGDALPTGADGAAYWEIVPRLSAPARFGPFEMEAEFYFDDDRGLSSIRLVPVQNIWCLDMIKYLLRIYTYQGPEDQAYVWQDKAGGNRIQLGRFATCTVTFLPGASRDASAVR